MKNKDYTSIRNYMSDAVLFLLDNLDDTNNYAEKLSIISDMSNYKSIKAYDCAYTLYTLHCDYDYWLKSVWYDGKAAEIWLLIAKNYHLDRLFNPYELYWFHSVLIAHIYKCIDRNPNSTLIDYAASILPRIKFDKNYQNMFFFKKRFDVFADKYFYQKNFDMVAFIKLITDIQTKSMLTLDDVINYIGGDSIHINYSDSVSLSN